MCWRRAKETTACIRSWASPLRLVANANALTSPTCLLRSGRQARARQRRPVFSNNQVSCRKLQPHSPLDRASRDVEGREGEKTVQGLENEGETGDGGGRVCAHSKKRLQTRSGRVERGAGCMMCVTAQFVPRLVVRFNASCEFTGIDQHSNPQRALQRATSQGGRGLMRSSIPDSSLAPADESGMARSIDTEAHHETMH
eukprot:3076285-Rhodomonas_salina.3